MKKGFTLIEVLVSLFIFTLVILAAYKIYDHSQKTYILGEQLTDTQQSTRFAFEKVSLDLRTAGYRVYPDTDALRPDLPVEGMWSGAIAVRADFDRAEETALECTKDATTNECQANTGQYQLVTTGSRDIRVFVLAKKAGEAVDGSDETLVFKADLSVPRDGIIGDLSTLETVTIPGISLAQDKPPYKLYMVSFLPEDSDDPPYSVSDGGDVPANHLVWTPIADGIFSMHFDYYNQNGIADANLMAYDDADISNPSDLVLFRRTHGWPFGGSASGGGNTVRNAVVRIIGMTARPDGQYTDPQINNASLSTEEIAARTLTKMYRKYELTTTINMLNVGVAPHELADTNPPDDPTQLDAVVGYCGGALLAWNPSLAPDMAIYWIQVIDSGLWSTWDEDWKYNCDDAPNTCVGTSNPEDYAALGRVGFFIPKLTNGATYQARVFAQDSAGNFSRNPTNAIEFTVDPSPLKPLGAEVVAGASADVGGVQRLQVTFAPPTEYDTGQDSSCIGDVATKDGRWPTVRDLYGYRLYHRRQTTATPVDFTAVPEDLVADENNPAANPLRVPMVNAPDVKACPCEYYAYKMKSVTQCTDAEDDPPCVHTGDTSILSHDADGNPTAYLSPYLNADLAAFPQVVPAQPAKPGASSVLLSGEDYDITLQILPVLTSNLKDAGGVFSANPAADQQVEVWRYRIYEYTQNPDIVSGATATRVDDIDTSGTGDTEDWDAAIDGGVTGILGPATAIKFTFAGKIPAGEMRWYAVTGLYRCTGGTDIFEGPRSLAASVPCNASWALNITAPAVDGTIVNTFGSTYTITAAVTGLSGVTVSEMKLTIAGTGIINEPLTCSGSPSCTGTYAWNLTGLPENDYPIIVTVVDSAGCSSSFTRIARVVQLCTDFEIFSPTVAANQLTWELRKINGTDVALLDKIKFTSTDTYLMSKLTFGRLFTTPAETTLWSGTAANFNGKSLALSGGDYPYANVNLCNTTPPRGLDLEPYSYPTSTVTYSTWFQATYDKNITAGNGPINLVGHFSGRKCVPTTVPISVGKKAVVPYTVPAGNLPICAWEWSYTGKAPSIDAANICAGTIVFTGANSGAAEVSLTYWTPGGSFECFNKPILMGP